MLKLSGMLPGNVLPALYVNGCSAPARVAVPPFNSGVQATLRLEPSNPKVWLLAKTNESPRSPCPRVTSFITPSPSPLSCVINCDA